MDDQIDRIIEKRCWKGDIRLMINCSAV